MDVQGLNLEGLLLPGIPNGFMEQLVCSICLDIFLKPVSCKSGHTFCHSCILVATQKTPTCPGGCNVRFPIEEPTRVIKIQGIVDALQCRCPHAREVVVKEEPPAKKAKKEGGDAKIPNVIDSAGGSRSSNSGVAAAAGQCTWTGPFGQLRDHLVRCGLESCGFQGCAFEGRWGVLAAHRLACPKRPVPCPHCLKAFAFDGLEGHLAVCDEVHVACPFACMGCDISLARKSMPAHLASNGIQHAALLMTNQQTQPMPSASIYLTIKNVEEKIAGNTTIHSPTVSFPLARFPQGQVYLLVRFGDSSDGVQRDGKTLSVFALFTCPGAPAVEPPPEICYQGTTLTLVSQDGAVKNLEECMTDLDNKSPLGKGRGWSEFCEDVTPFIKDNTIVVGATIRVRPAAPADAATLKHTVA